MADWSAMGISRYRSSYNKSTGCFYVLDTWHESIKNIPESQLDKEIPDSSPAVKILTSEEVNSLLENLKEIGWLEKFSTGEKSIEYKHIERTPTVQEIAISNIEKIVELKSDKAVSQEGILAIREIINGIGR